MTNKVIVSKIVGELQIVGEASSDRRDVSMQELLDIATAATGEQTVTGMDGVNITVNMIGPDAPAAPLFTPAAESPLCTAAEAFDGAFKKVSREHKITYLCRMVDWGYKPYYTTCEFSRLTDAQIDVEVDVAEHWEKSESTEAQLRASGTHCGRITPAREIEQIDRAAEVRDNVLAGFRQQLVDASIGYKLGREGFTLAIDSVISKATDLYRKQLEGAAKDHVELNRLQHDKLTLTKRVTERDSQINELIQQVSKLNEEISQMAKSGEHERGKLKEQITEYQRRLNVIRSSLDAIECVI